MRTSDRNSQLATLVSRGGKAARDEMIESNMAIVAGKVNDYLICFPHLAYLKDDLIGDGNLALVDAADRIMRGEVADKNLMGYLRVAVAIAIGHSIDAELYSSDRSARRHRQNGEDPHPFHKVPNSDHVLSELGHDPRPETELLNLIVSQCETDEERAIVDLRMKGYKDDEIARQLDIPKTTIFMLRRELYQRCLETGEIVSD